MKSTGFISVLLIGLILNSFAQGNVDIYLANSSFYNGYYNNSNCEIVNSVNYFSCCKSRKVKVWVNGYWKHHHHGHRRWIPGYWEFKTERIRCSHHDAFYNPYQGYDGTIGCHDPIINEFDFDHIIYSIRNRDFESSKLSIAKQSVAHRAIWAKQVKMIMLEFDFESTRLEFAKFAYSRTIDIDRYFIVNDAFDFESSIRNLNNFIYR